MKLVYGVGCLTLSVNGNISLTKAFLSIVKLVFDLRVGPSFQFHPLHGYFSVTVNLFGSEVAIVATTDVCLGGHVLHEDHGDKAFSS